MFDFNTPIALQTLTTLATRLEQATHLKVNVLAETDSTNARLLALAETLPLAFEPAYACLALRQTAGRGRMGRAWTVANQHSNPAFLASIGLRTPLPLSALGALPLHVGVAIAQYLQGLGVDVGVKWPNDLVLRQFNSNTANTANTANIVNTDADTDTDNLNGSSSLLAKLGGILIETRSVDNIPNQAQGTAVVIGVGINWYDAPCMAGRATACVAENLPRCNLPSSESAAAALLNAMHLAWQRTQQGQRCDFAAFDVLAGQAITLHPTRQTQTNGVSTPMAMPLVGIAQGINAQGYLGLRTPKGLQWLHSGEVSLSKPMLTES